MMHRGTGRRRPSCSMGCHQTAAAAAAGCAVNDCVGLVRRLLAWDCSQRGLQVCCQCWDHVAHNRCCECIRYRVCCLLRTLQKTSRCDRLSCHQRSL